jgi:hypothetical protein
MVGDDRDPEFGWETFHEVFPTYLILRADD